MFSLAKIIFYIILIFNFSIVQSAEKIVYLDIDQVLNKTIIGKEIIKNLDTLRKKNLNDIKKKQTALTVKRDK